MIKIGVESIKLAYYWNNISDDIKLMIVTRLINGNTEDRLFIEKQINEFYDLYFYTVGGKK